jgi:hypothetical protein
MYTTYPDAIPSFKGGGVHPTFTATSYSPPFFRENAEDENSHVTSVGQTVGMLCPVAHVTDAASVDVTPSIVDTITSKEYSVDGRRLPTTMWVSPPALTVASRPPAVRYLTRGGFFSREMGR